MLCGNFPPRPGSRLNDLPTRVTRAALHATSLNMRLRSDIWVSAYIRRCGVEGVVAVLRRRGAAEAGAIAVKIDRLDGTGELYSPAPQSLMLEDALDRVFERVLPQATPVMDIEARLERDIRFDSDLWIVEVEARDGRHFLTLADEA